MKSSDFIIKEEIRIPYSDQVDSFSKTFKNGGESRGLNPVVYAIKRLRNYTLFWLAYTAPSNKLRVLFNRWKGVNIADGAYIGMSVSVDNAYPEFIYIEENASISAGCMLVAHFNPKIHLKRIMPATASPIVIKKGAVVAVRSIVLPGVTIGENAIVTANSVVNLDVEPNTFVRGNPAVAVGKFKL